MNVYSALRQVLIEHLEHVLSIQLLHVWTMPTSICGAKTFFQTSVRFLWLSMFPLNHSLFFWCTLSGVDDAKLRPEHEVRVNLPMDSPVADQSLMDLKKTNRFLHLCNAVWMDESPAIVRVGCQNTWAKTALIECRHYSVKNILSSCLNFLFPG